MQPAVTLVFSLTNVGIVFLGSRLISGRIMEIGSLLTFLTLCHPDSDEFHDAIHALYRDSLGFCFSQKNQ